MIDDKKMEKAIEDYVRYSSVEDEYPGTEGEAFKAGANWAINEFLKNGSLKNLWHPAIEKPKRRCNYLLLHYKDEEEECFEADVVDTKAWDCYIKDSLVEYINIDDLFPSSSKSIVKLRRNSYGTT